MTSKNKIGILTYHYKDNFGALLQCHALQEYLKTLGYDVEVVNFKPKKHAIIKLASLVKNHFIYVFRNFKLANVNIYIRQFKALIVQTNKFNLFRKNYLNISKLYDANKKTHDLNSYDYVITGSDQIWNSIDGFYDAYFIIPFSSYKGKRFAYAACRGVKTVNEDDLAPLKKALENYDWVGVRDNQTQDFVQTNSDQLADVVCDPSMLINFNDLSETKPPLEFKYIFVYILGKEIEGGHLNIIKDIKAKVGNLKVVACYLTSKNPNYFPWADVHMFESSPLEWMNLIKHTSFFYTDSFHGVLFANKFERNFLAFYAEKNRASRLLDIADRLDISNYIVSSYDQVIEKDSFNTSLNNGRCKVLAEKFISDSKEILSKKLNS
jgi:hypothetical protein